MRKDFNLFFLLCTVLCIFYCTTVSSQTQMAIWNFASVANAATNPFNATTDSVSGTPSLQQFFQNIDNNGIAGTAYTDVNGVNHSASNAISWNDIKGSGTDAELIITVNTAGWDSIFLRFDYKSESANSFDIEYSNDGGSTWTQIINNTSINSDGFNNWDSKTVNLTSFTALEDEPNLQIKIQDLDNSGDDQFAFDNVELYGSKGTNKPSIVLHSSTTDYLNLDTANTTNGLASGVIDDVTDPCRTKGFTFRLKDGDTPLNLLTLSATSSDNSVVPNANLTFITINDSTRNLRIDPSGVGYADITVTVSDGSASDSYLINFAASDTAYDVVNTDFHTGISDASTAIDVGNNFFLGGDDESNALHLYHKDSSGYFFNEFDIAGPMGISGEGDFEASCKKGSKAYWMGSLGNSVSGNIQTSRHRFFATTLTGSGSSTVASYIGSYNMRPSMISWGDAHGYDFSSSAASGMIPKQIDGFNVEGMCLGPNDTSLYIGFRAPLVPIGNRTKALICPIKNFEAWFNNGSPIGSPVFGNPIELNLGGRGIRSIEKNANGQYLIVAGSYDNVHNAALFEWNGVPTSAPVLLAADLTSLNPEGIVSFPSPFYNGSTVELMSDDGTQIWYGDGIENKLLPDMENKKFRTVKVVTTGGTLQPCVNPVLTSVTASQPTICTGDSSALNIIGNLNGATTWKIYTDSCGGTSVDSTAGASVMVSPSVTTTYYIRGEGGCALANSCSPVTIAVSICTDISQANLSNSFNVFPNPVSDLFTIEATGISHYQVMIYNSIGQLVLSQNSQGIKTNIIVSDFSTGVYHVRLLTNSGVVIKRIIKN
ncbi:MAG: T9SS type A sorting domain-containing protein [Bacteroidia bacterium]|nr:T9SS type A sorting domain-containing protein [Bacteroidia bacterium]